LIAAPHLALPNHNRQAPPSWRRLALLAVLFLTLWPVAGGAQEVPELQIHSKEYIVIDAATGEVYAQRGAHKRAAMASLTKIFTTIEALERGSPDMEITTHQSDVFDASSTRMGFGAGETFTLHDLLYGMMLPSGNDAAHAIARALGYQPGDTDQEAVDRFVGWMNQRVQDMGLHDTHLVNPHGWGVPNHYTTVWDLAAFTRYALQYPTFVQVISTAVYDIPGGYEVTNTNKMLNTYSDLIGGKTGYDDDAGWCLVEVARRGDTTMISVTFNGIAPDDWYDDNRVLLNYAFQQKAQRVAAGVSFTGDVVTFRDPDAAVIGRSATAGGSLPAPETSTNVDDKHQSQTTDNQTGQPAVEENSQHDRGGTTRGLPTKLLVAIGIAALVIGVQIVAGLNAQRRRRSAGGGPAP
jgi:D-alanyl-D-alanine carboxypeptidase